MLEKVNGGDQAALKAFLQTYAKHIFERAKTKSPDEFIAREATRIAVLKIRQTAEAGEIPAEPVPWIDRVTDESVQRLILPLGTVKKNPQPTVDTPTPAKAPQTAMREPITTQQRQVQAQPQQPTRQQPPIQQPMRQMPVQQQPAQQPLQQQPVRQMPVQQARPLHAAQPEEQRRRARQSEDARDAQRIPALFGDDAAETEIEDELPKKKKKKEDAPVGMVLLIFLLVMVVLSLIWMLLVMLMSKGYLPVMDFGFAQWFNTNVFQLF